MDYLWITLKTILKQCIFLKRYIFDTRASATFMYYIAVFLCLVLLLFDSGFKFYSGLLAVSLFLIFIL